MKALKYALSLTLAALVVLLSLFLPEILAQRLDGELLNKPREDASPLPAYHTQTWLRQSALLLLDEALSGGAATLEDTGQSAPALEVEENTVFWSVAQNASGREWILRGERDGVSIERTYWVYIYTGASQGDGSLTAYRDAETGVIARVEILSEDTRRFAGELSRAAGSYLAARNRSALDGSVGADDEDLRLDIWVSAALAVGLDIESFQIGREAHEMLMQVGERGRNYTQTAVYSGVTDSEWSDMRYSTLADAQGADSGGIYVFFESLEGKHRVRLSSQNGAIVFSLLPAN